MTDLQAAARREWERAEELPVGSKVGFTLSESVLLHETCESPCEDVRAVVLRDEPALFHFLLIGRCTLCDEFVWANKSVDAEGRVMTYGENMEPLAEGVLRSGE